MNGIAEVSPQEIGRRIMQVREAAGLKQAELARQITWSPTILSRVESGERQLSAEELKVVIEAIGTPEARHLSNVLERDWQLLPRPPLDHPDQDALWEAEQVCRKLTKLKNQPDVPHAFERRWAEYLDDIQATACLLLKREHDVALIGSLGIGKSTAICKVTGLEVSNPDSGVAAPVLEAGAGGITICEVHLRTGPSYGLLIEPCSEDEIRAHVTDFAEHILGENGSDTTETGTNGDVSQGISKEIERAIRNMSGLRVRREKNQDGKTLRRDEAKDLAAQMPSARELAVEVLSRMELHRRDRRDMWYEPSTGKAALAWLKDVFEQVNNGRHPEFTLPNRIEVVVPQTLLGTSEFAIRLIDTKGIDRIAARADLEKHLNEPHTLAMLCSGFNEAPATSAYLLLERAKQARFRGLERNTALLVLARPAEALAVKDETGALVQTVEEGYELKGEQVQMALEPLRLRPTVEFFNSFGDDPERLRARIIDCIQKIRQNFRTHLHEVSSDAQAVIANHEKEQVQEVLRNAARMMNTWIEQHRALPPLAGHVQDSLMSQLRIAYPSTIHASIRREGEWINLSYGYHLGYGARRLAAVAIESSVGGFKDMTETMEANSDYKGAKDLTQQARRVLDTAFEDLLRKIQIMGQTLFKDALKLDPLFWWDCQKEWGQGPGYKVRITERNDTWFTGGERRELEKELWDVITREWNTVLSRLASLLEIDSPAEAAGS
jgi:transcriptional regulator with XRE-family HTH domain